MKKIINFISVFFVLLISANSLICSAISWYCPREKNHQQPTLSQDLKFCEKYSVFWCDQECNNNDKVIYLTFDAGYENGNVEKIVKTLNEEDVKAAFFVLDNFLIKNKNLINKMINSGHIIANHTFKHRDMTKIESKEEFKEELEKLEELYKIEYGQDMPKYYRPPEGKINEKSLKWATELGYKTVMWSFAYADWDNNSQPSREYALKKILDNVHNGEVMLLHPTSSTNAEIMGELITELKKQGFRFGTLDELCNNS